MTELTTRLEERVEHQLHIETYERSISAAFTFFILGAIVSIYQFNSPSYSTIFLGLGVGLCIVNATRLLIAYQASKNTINFTEYKSLFYILVLTNSFLWSLVFSFVFYESNTNSIESKLAFLVLIGISAGAPHSLVTMPRLQLIFFILTSLVPAGVLTFKHYRIEGASDLLIEPVLLVTVFIFFTTMSRKLRALLIKSIRDHEELRLTQGELLIEKAKSLNSERLAFLGNMASGVAHEINNPLTISFGQISSMQNHLSEIENEKVRDHYLSKLNIMTEVNLRIKNIVKGLLDFSTEGEQEKFENFKLKEILDFAFQFFEHKLKSNGIHFEKDAIPEIIIHCRKSQFAQAIVHVMNNAIEAVELQNQKIISMKFKTNFKTLNIQIEDTGIGIDPDIAAKIFDPFFTTKPVGKGTGLGLSVAMGILKSHKGTISLVQNANRTIFNLEIPFY